MRRAISIIGLLAAALVVALIFRVRQLRAAGHGPAGGTGVVEGVDVAVESRIAARLLQVNVREGDIVKAGQALVVLDCTESRAALEQAGAQLRAAEATYAAARASASAAGRSASAAVDNAGAAKAQIAAIEAQLRLAETELARTQRLVATSALPQSSLDDAQSRYDTLVSQVIAQRATEGATVDEASAQRANGTAANSQELAAQRNVTASQAAVARAQVNVDECTLVAPRDAMVQTRDHEPGEAVMPGTVVLMLTDLSDARTRFYLPNDQIGTAAPGKKVKVVADAYPGEAFEGAILYVSPRAEFTPRNVQTRDDRERLVYAVEVRIPNVDMRLRSGMPVEVSIEGTYK